MSSEYSHRSKQLHARKDVMFAYQSAERVLGCSKEPSRGDGSFEYPKRMFWLRNMKNHVQGRILSGGLII